MTGQRCGQGETSHVYSAANGLPRGRPYAFKGGRIAQVVEQLTLNQRVVGSSPTAPTKEINNLKQKLNLSQFV